MGEPIAWRGFYAILDPAECRTSPLETAEAILDGGCAVFQLRDKRGDDRETLALARALAARCRMVNVPFVVNDRVDLALLSEADGVHLGQDDMSVVDARQIFSGVIGLSTHSLEQALSADADLIGFGPVFDTKTKVNPDPTVGLDALREVCAQVEVPVVAIGGISVQRASQVAQTGAQLGAAIGAVCKADDPRTSARAIHGAWS